MCKSWQQVISSCLIICAALGISGCAGGLLSALTSSELPAEVAYVVNNKSAFTCTQTDAGQSLEPGTVIDDLDHLTGCWAFVVEEASKPIRFYFVHHFDVSAGEYTFWTYQQDDFGLFSMLATTSGQVAIIDENHIALTEQERASFDPFTGGWDQVVPEPEPVTDTYLVTVDGDNLLLALDSEEDSQSSDDDDIPFCGIRRFDCPE